jgi:hypothetical protein
MWPELTVRSWQGVLARRDPDWSGWADDDYAEATDARRLHELRGLVMAQVAEIEDLLKELLKKADELQPMVKVDKNRRLPTGVTLNRLEALLKSWNLLGDLGGQIGTVRRAIKRRNALVHARVHIGFSLQGEYGPREPVIALLFSNDPDEGASGINEFELERELGLAHAALDAAVDIWQCTDDYISQRMTDRRLQTRPLSTQ